MKRYLVWISALLMLIELLNFSPTVLANIDKWTKKASMPTPRWELSTSVVNEKIYAIGGLGLGDMVLTTVEEYDPKTNKWTKKADMPTARHSFSTSAVDGKTYAIGGQGRGGVFLSTVEEYDPLMDKWTKKADMPTKRMWLSTSVVNGKIYAIGGWNGTYLATLEEYDPKTDKWVKSEVLKANMPTARGSLSTITLNGKIYAIGGRTEVLGPPGVVSYSIVEEYNPATSKWTKKADMPTERWGLSTSVMNGKIYAIGGASARMFFQSTVEEYDPKTDKWTTKSDMPTPRDALATSAVNEKIYAIGGAQFGPDPKPLSTVEEYDPDFKGLGVEPKGKLPMYWGKIKRSER